MRDGTTVGEVTIEYDAETDTYRAECAYDDMPPSAVVVRAIAEIDGRAPSSLEPLYAAVDPDALDDLFRPSRTGIHRGDGSVSFGYGGYHVTVHSYGIVEIGPTEDAA